MSEDEAMGRVGEGRTGWVCGGCGTGMKRGTRAAAEKTMPVRRSAAIPLKRQEQRQPWTRPQRNLGMKGERGAWREAHQHQQCKAASCPASSGAVSKEMALQAVPLHLALMLTEEGE